VYHVGVAYALVYCEKRKQAPAASLCAVTGTAVRRAASTEESWALLGGELGMITVVKVLVEEPDLTG
jgi:hypothetical protein